MIVSRIFGRPLLVVLAVVFVAVAAVDLVQTLREEPAPPPKMLRPGAVSFEPLEPVVDLRDGGPDPAVNLLPVPRPVGGLWSQPNHHGTWALGDGAKLELRLALGGQRVLVLEARPAGGRRPVRSVGLSVNGISCGALDVQPGWQHLSFSVPEGVLRAGDNTIAVHLPDRASVARPRRALQVRRLELLAGAVRGERAPDVPPLTVDFERQRLVVRTPGVLEVPFGVDDRVDALRMRYVYLGSDLPGEMVVARPLGGGVGRDAEIRRALSPSLDGGGRVRVPLHGRRGQFVLRVVIGPWSNGSRFEIRSLELVSEGGRSRNRVDRPD